MKPTLEALAEEYAKQFPHDYEEAYREATQLFDQELAKRVEEASFLNLDFGFYDMNHLKIHVYRGKFGQKTITVRQSLEAEAALNNQTKEKGNGR